MAPPTNGPPTFTIDAVNRFLDKFPFSPPGAVVIALASYLRSNSAAGTTLSEILRHFRSPDQKWMFYFLAFVAAKTINRALNRLVLNHGWRADKPVWSLVKGKGDICVITGGSTGIGKEFVDILSKQTANIAVLDLAKPTYLAKNVHWYECDVSNPASIAAVATKIRADLGEPTVLLCNAGIARGTTILETTADQFLLTYRVNVLGIHNMLREFLPHIVKINHGHIMTVASSASYMSIAQMSEYSCSKAAALALHEVLFQELIHRYNAPRVRTSVVCPTKVSTQMGDAMTETDNQFLTPTLSATWLAGRMVEIVSSGLSDHLIAPQFAATMLPAIRFFPEYFRWIVNKVGKTNATITNAGNEAQGKVYKIVDVLEAHQRKQD